MLEPELLSMLICPNCRGKSECQSEPERLICPTCRIKSRADQGVSIMLFDQSERF